MQQIATNLFWMPILYRLARRSGQSRIAAVGNSLRVMR